jgi:3-oxoadipate enol-lactonase / 4-carboxymuconolactone decarboxylase
MPLIPLNDISCFYRVEGLDSAPVVVFAHSLGLDHGQWDAQAADLRNHFVVVRYDIRGHGASGVTFGDYTIERLGRDALALLDALGLPRVAWCGLSLGGMIGQWIAANAPDRLTYLVLANTSPRLTDPSTMESRRMAVNQGGMKAVEPLVMSRFFSSETLASGSAAVAWARRTLLATNPVGYANCCAAIRDMDLTPLLDRIKTPTLVISGERDVSMPWPDHGEKLADGIPGTRVVKLDAAHISNIEKPRSFTGALFDFLLPTASGTTEGGFAVRRRVLGSAHVEGAVAAATELTRDFQDLITRFAWGSVWARPGLDYRTRRLLVLATTAALGRWEEFRLHVRTGLEHELEASDLKEVLLQTALYSGIPAANTAFGIASEEIERLKLPAPDSQLPNG